MRNSARQHADQENSLFCTNAEIDALINANIRKVHRRIVKAYGNAYAGSSTTITTAAGTEAYALPATFMKLSSYGVWWVAGNEKRRISRYDPNRSNDQEPNAGWTHYSRRAGVQYDLFNKEIRFLPTPQAVHSVKVYFIPTPTLLVADADVYDGIAGFEQGIIWATAADMLAKQESDASYQLAMAESEFKDLLEYADPDQNEPPQVQWVDVCEDY
jgi:hypothetical protein